MASNNTVPVSSANNGNSVQVTNIKSEYYANIAKEYAQQAEQYCEDVQEYADAAKTELTQIKNAAISEMSSEADEKVLLAQSWAVKMDGIVNGEDYSSKYYARQSQSSAETAESLLTEVETAHSDALQAISTAQTTAVGAVDTAKTTAVSSIDTAKSAAITGIETAGESAVDEVNTAKTAALSDITSEKNSAITEIESYTEIAQNWAAKTDAPVENDLYSAKYYADMAGETVDTALENINTAKAAALNDISTQKNSAINDINSEKSTVISTIETAENEAVTEITSKHTTAVNEIEQDRSDAVGEISGLKTSAVNEISGYVTEAENWATKMDAPVEDSLYSAKYYARQASDIVAGGVSQATENILGGAKIATAADMTTGTDDTKMVTPLKAKGFIDECLSNFEQEAVLPSGGMTGQILCKKSDLDYDAEWTDGLVPDTVQLKEDQGLSTSNKTVVGAINEIKNNVDGMIITPDSTYSNPAVYAGNDFNSITDILETISLPTGEVVYFDNILNLTETGYYIITAYASFATISSMSGSKINWQFQILEGENVTNLGVTSIVIPNARNTYRTLTAIAFIQNPTQVKLLAQSAITTSINANLLKFSAVRVYSPFDLDEIQADVDTLQSEITQKVNSSDLSPVATSGSYNDLTDVPEDSIVQTCSDLSNGTIVLNRNISIYRHTATAAITFSFDTSGLGLTNGETATFELKVTMAAVQTLTFPASVKWLDGEAPDVSSAGIYYFVFRTDDNGTTWYGNSQGRWDV